MELKTIKMSVTPNSFDNRTFFSKEIILVDDNNKIIDRMYFKDGQKLAQEQGLDLVEVNKQNNISICKIVDKGKYLYEQSKKLKENRKIQNKQRVRTKEIKFGVRIQPHDIEVKVNHIKSFIQDGDDVKIVVFLKGREKSHFEKADSLMKTIVEMLAGFGKLDDIKKNPSEISVLIRH